MYANSRGTSNVRGARRRATRARRALAALSGLAVLGAAACSGSSEAASDQSNPTFTRASGSAIAYEEPASSVSDLLAPAGEGQPWLVVGSTFDPKSGTTTTAATWTAGDGHSWERHEVEPDHKGVSEGMSAAIRTDDGGLAVGWAGDSAESDATVWRQDGDEWVRSAPEAMAGEHEQWAFDVATGEGGILVAGGENVWGEVRPRLWFSADGTKWESVDGGPGGTFDATGGESVRRVAAVGSGFVAVGSVDVDNNQDGVAWYSSDGRSWSRVEASSLGGPGRQELQSVTWTGKAVVAGGYRTDGNGQGQPFVWRSADGKVWSKPSPPLPLYDDSRSAAADYGVTSLSYGGGGITAVGGNDWRPHLWWSADGGQSWRRLPNPVYDTLFADGVSLVDSAVAGKVRVALGSEPNALFLNQAGRWQDASGKAFPNGGAQPFATAAVTGKQGTVVAGGRHTAPQGATRETYAGQIWVEADGGWQAVDSKQLAEGRITDLVATKSGYVAVGVEDFGLAARRQYVGDKLPDGLVWTSPDGRKWTRVGATISKVPDEMLELIEDPNAAAATPITDILGSQPPETVEPAGGKGTRSLDAAAPIGNGFIAVGVAYVDGAATPIAVVSPDGKALKGENPGAAGEGNRRFNDVCVNDGTAVAVGSLGKDNAYDLLVRHRAKDGKWSEVTDDGSFAGAGSQQAYGCAAGRDGFVIVGSDDRSGDTDARVWTSKDGLEWTRVSSGLLGGGGDQWASAVTAVPGGGWLIGGTDTAAGDGDIALWRVLGNGEVSRRDRGEPELGGVGEQSVTHITVDDDRVLIVGDDYGRVGLWESDTIDR